MKPINLGLIGVGFHAGSVHLPALAVVPELRLTALATSREVSSREAADRYRVPGYADYRELLARADIEAVLVATSCDAHEAICREALRSGKHVFVESPGVPDIAAARELRALSEEKKLVMQVGYVLRYAPPFEVLRSHLDKQSSPRLLSYEYFPYLGHTYNLALYLSGKVESINSVTQNVAGSTATLNFQNGDVAVIVGRTLHNCSVDIESVRVSTAGFYGAVEGRRRIRIIENMQPTNVGDWSTASSGGLTYEPQPFAGRFLESSGAAPQLRGFAAAIREHRPPRSTLTDAIETLELTGEIARHLERRS